MSTKFVPLTTRPASTSRQGMTRLRCTDPRLRGQVALGGRQARHAFGEVVVVDRQRQARVAGAAGAEALAGRDRDARALEQALRREPVGQAPPGVEGALGRVEPESLDED